MITKTFFLAKEKSPMTATIVRDHGAASLLADLGWGGLAGRRGRTALRVDPQQRSQPCTDRNAAR
jgi:hypothetical protein